MHPFWLGVIVGGPIWFCAVLIGLGLLSTVVSKGIHNRKEDR
jgi:hypothetical protein